MWKLTCIDLSPVAVENDQLTLYWIEIVGDAEIEYNATKCLALKKLCIKRRGSDGVFKESTIVFLHPIVTTLADDAPSSSNANNNQLPMLRTKFGFLAGRNFVLRAQGWDLSSKPVSCDLGWSQQVLMELDESFSGSFRVLQKARSKNRVGKVVCEELD